MIKITKIKTRGGELGVPVTTDLDTIVERMRSDDTKDAAKRVGTVALHSRLAEAQGMPRYYIKDADDLPYLVFSATFGKSGFDQPISFSQVQVSGFHIQLPGNLRHRQASFITLVFTLQGVPHNALVLYLKIIQQSI